MIEVESITAHDEPDERVSENEPSNATNSPSRQLTENDSSQKENNNSGQPAAADHYQVTGAGHEHTRSAIAEEFMAYDITNKFRLIWIELAWYCSLHHLE
ncbi:hypothetical protein NicSoilB11_31480 [Arthrobacter sp. NicSoilB11]|nr:hypothetical protein NicSoilB11_31480 [Arthrobacter sp. NicSoilB11]